MDYPADLENWVSNPLPNHVGDVLQDHFPLTVSSLGLKGSALRASNDLDF